MTKAPSPTEMLMAAQDLRQDVLLDLRGVPSGKHGEIRSKLDLLERKINHASSLMMKAAFHGVEGK